LFKTLALTSNRQSLLFSAGKYINMPKQRPSRRQMRGKKPKLNQTKWLAEKRKRMQELIAKGMDPTIAEQTAEARMRELYRPL